MSTAIEQDKSAPARPERTPRSISPHVNIFEEKDGYTIQAEMPGVTHAGLDITVEGTELTLVGHRHREELPADVLYRESYDADYQRTFELDPAIDTSKIEANMEQGVLTLRLPKSERAKPQKITVNG